MTPEDEAFDELAKRQGAWGGGFPAKRKMAADKFIAAEEHKVGERYGYVPKLHPSEWMDAQPAQEPAKNMTYKEFLEFVPSKCVYETIYDDSEGRTILVICMLDAYGMVNRILKEKNNGA
jgi:hypothetical protein